nr:MAG TPA: hypothetical protein [Caudoviricetes sp.]
MIRFSVYTTYIVCSRIGRFFYEYIYRAIAANYVRAVC